MGKNQSASNLPNIIQYNNGSINFVSGSTLLMQISSSGAITTTGVISGSNALSSSYAVSSSYSQNSELLDNLDSTSFVFTSSYNTDSSSVSTRVSKIEGNYATTGSNVFLGAQTVCANITSTGTIIAQTLNVQQVTSSVVYSSGSNIFGCLLTDRQQFTGSVTITGSLNTTGTICSTGNTCFGGMSVITSCLGIGTSTPAAILHVSQPSANTVFRLGNNTTYDQFVYFNGNNDWSLGMDYSNSNAFVLSNSSTIGTNDRVVVTTGGDVGIGTDSPAAKLDVNGIAYFRSPSGIYSDRLVAYSGGDVTIQYGASGNLIVTGGSGGSERMRLTSAGIACFACQICANSISGISGNFRSCTFFGSIDLENTGGDVAGKWNVQSVSGAQIGGSAGSSFGIYSYGASAYRLFINSSGNVGIGTTSPTNKLHVVGSSSTDENVAPIFITHDFSGTYGFGLAISRDASTSTAALSLGADSSTNAIIASNNSDLRIGKQQSSAFSEYVRINTSGNVGINTTSPGGRLEVKANDSYAPANQSNIRLTNAGYRNDDLSSYSEGGYLDFYFENYNDSYGGTVYDRVLDIVAKGSPDGTYGKGVIRFKANPKTASSNATEIMRIQGDNKVVVTGNVNPSANGTYDLGTSSLRWSTVYTSDLSLSNGIGDYTIVEGENDLFLYNNKTNKVFKFVVEEVDPSTATPKKS
jgi:hypothetical protein